MSPSSRRVGVAFGGPSPEHDVSILTGLQAARALAASGAAGSVTGLYWAKDGSWREVGIELEAQAFLDGVPKTSQALELAIGPDGGFRRAGRSRLGSGPKPLELDAVLVCCHGGPGEDGSLQAALDLAGIAYSGPSASAAALGMDKLASYGAFRAAGLPALERRVLDGALIAPGESGPFIVKPRFGGSSIGIEVVADSTTALARLDANVHLRRGAVIEAYRPECYDLEIAVRTWPKPELSAIARPLRPEGGSEILNYSHKYVAGQGMAAAPRELPAALEAGLEAHIREAALALIAVVGLRGVARVDFLTDGTELLVNEVNLVPGSLSRYLFVSPPVSFEELLSGLVEEAIERPAIRFSSAGADGTVLREAGSIAAKLA